MTAAHRARFAGSRGTRYTRAMRLRSIAVFASASVLSLVAFGCVEKQESAPQQQPAPPPQTVESAPAKPKFDLKGIPIKKGVGMQGMMIGNGPVATPPPPATNASAAPAPSGPASK